MKRTLLFTSLVLVGTLLTAVVASVLGLGTMPSFGPERPTEQSESTPISESVTQTSDPTLTPEPAPTTSPPSTSTSTPTPRPDSDADGLPDVNDPYPDDPDYDNDGLSDGRERELGTNLTLKDTDNDSLQDGWEVEGETPWGMNISEADPTEMDLYVRYFIYWGDSIREGEIPTLDSYEQTNDYLRRQFMAWDVRGGIDVHVLPHRNLSWNETTDDRMQAVESRYHDQNPHGVVRWIYVVERDDGWMSGQPRGVAMKGENITVMYASVPSWIGHELVHTIVRELDSDRYECTHGDGHLCEGLMSPDADAVVWYQEINPNLADEIAEEGFGG